MSKLVFLLSMTGILFVTSQTIGHSANLVRGPYLQQGTPTGVTVCWRTDVSTNSLVRYGTNDSMLTLEMSNAGSQTNHTVRLSGLLPDTRYYYSVGSAAEVLGEGETFTFRTAPPAGSTRPFRIWVLGDFGYTNRSAMAVRDGFYAANGSAPIDLWLMLGDNAYHGGSDAVWQTAVFDTFATLLRQTVVWSTIGNQETGGGSTLSPSRPYLDVFHFPTQGESGGVASGTEQYYSFDFGNAHFICLDSMSSDRSSASAMLTWLASDLASTTNHWTIAFWHHPPYSKGSRNSDTESIQVEMRENALPLLEQYGVDLVLCGHSHVYERSYLLDGHYGLSSTFEESHLIDGGDGRVDGDGAYHKEWLGSAPHQGAVYIVAGSGSSLGTGSLDHPAMYRSLGELGSVLLDIHANRLEAKFIHESGTTNDYFTLIKGDNLPRLSVPLREENEIILRWNSIADRTYRVLASPTANPEMESWIDVSGPVPAPDAVTEWREPAPTTTTNRFYRLRSEED